MPFPDGLNPIATCPFLLTNGPMLSDGRCARAFFCVQRNFFGKRGIQLTLQKKRQLKRPSKWLKFTATLVEDLLAIPVIIGEKSPGERFPGAVTTYTLEAMMQDRKALQAWHFPLFRAEFFQSIEHSLLQ